MAKVLVVHEDQVVGNNIGTALQSAGGYSLAGTVGSGQEALAFAGGAEVALVSIYVSDMDGFELINQLRERGVVVVPLLTGSEGGDIWQSILAQDLRDVVVGIPDPASLVQTIRAAQAHASETSAPSGTASDPSYLISVASARGGVGKTIFAVNLAIAMAQYEARVALIDYSMFAGDFFSMLDQVPRNTVADAIGQGDSDESFVSSLMSQHPLGFSYLACPNDEFDFYGFDYESATTLLQVARRLYDFILVDTGVYDLPPTNAAVDESDLAFLVTNRDLARLMSLQRLIKDYKGRGYPDGKIKVIVNNAELGTEITEEEIEEVIEHPVTAYLPSIGTETTFSINSGKPLMTSKPELPMIGVLNKLAEYSVQRWAV